ncbi:GHKL domain-containing protein [Persephonella atlantica]|uniref:histidine kinase n=1 Tax=Persephonella atlantica TaxID=2699429 RepID=A0ABS1GG44_9AQUI|nr:ATP-binding protein [Persephonella atlantica]MBK3331893.1 GHKL domain-containing protein [Persephonella atlantica]
MYALIFSWLIYIVGAYLLEKDLKKILYPAGAVFFLVVYAVGVYLSDSTFLDGLVIIYLMFIFLHASRELQQRLRVITVTLFVFLFLTYLLLASYKVQYYETVIPISSLLLLLRQYRANTEILLWAGIILTALTLYFININLFFYINIAFVLFFMAETINEHHVEMDKEKKRYRDFVSRAINSEFQKRYAEIDDELKITYKKLKEIFKLSNYTLFPSDIEDIAERVVEGLHNLGYSGVVLYVNVGGNNIFKKSGFFPNLKSYLTEKFEKLNKITISEDEKSIFLPLISDKEKIGVLGVYKKEGATSKEIEYLSTYANSVAISITKTIYFKEINKLQQLLEKTFESVDIGIAIINREFQIERANRALKELTGFQSSNNIFDAIPEIEPLKKELQSVIEEKKVFDTVLSSIHRKGFIYRIKALPLISSNSSDADKIVLVIEDITEKEKLEAQLLETEKHAVIGKMAAGLSHDIKNPLAAISASAFAIKKKGERLKDNRIIELAEKIEKNSSRAADIINRLLNYAKPSYYRSEKVNLREVILSSIDFSIPDSRKKDIKVYKRLRSDIFTYGDKNALQQVFINLIINAVEAMNNRGRIDIKLTKNGNYAAISIKDYGPGIPEKMVEEIFDPFFTTKEKGTGLGLSVVSRIVKDHHGKIEVHSKEGEGTEFIIKLPLMED